MNRPNPFKIVTDAAVLLGVFFAVWFVVYSLVPTDWGYKPRIPIADEERLGKLLIDNYLEGEEVVENDEANTILAGITERLISTVPNTEYNYKFYIVRSTEANAFTLPGGNIVIFTGLIDLADTPEELAGVLSHEMGHAEKRHVIDRLVKEFGIAVIGSIVLGDNTGMLGGILKQAISTSFDRDQEREADDFALNTMVNAGIRPSFIADFFSKIEQKMGGMDKNMELISTHPDNAERIQKARTYKVPPGFKEKPFDAETVNFKRLKELINQ